VYGIVFLLCEYRLPGFSDATVAAKAVLGSCCHPLIEVQCYALIQGHMETVPPLLCKRLMPVIFSVGLAVSQTIV
jgi:hypothetical protein